MNVKTNVRKMAKWNSLHNIFNKKALKVSYSCMGNIVSIIPSHNRNVLYLIVAVENGCSCRPRNECPLQNKCLTSKIFYRSYVQNDTKKMMKKKL